MTTAPSGASTVEVIGGTSSAARKPLDRQPLDRQPLDRQPMDRPAVADRPGPPAEVTPLHPAGRTPSGRQRHDEKITVYLASGELLELERTRLELRARYGIGIDRGRIVREAIAIALAEFDQNGESSMLVRRLASGH